MDGKKFIGCSGYYYSYWKNRFYPEGTPAKDWLSYYAKVFKTVELNGTFYRTPRITTLQKYVAQTPSNFKFSAKMNRHITHVLRLKNCKTEIDNYLQLLQDGLGDKLANVLFQLPAGFKFSTENLENILENVPHQSGSVIEFRDISWWTEEVYEAFKKAQLTFCNVDFPGLASHIVHTSNLFYLRMHGSPELFKSSYSTRELKIYAKQIPQDKDAFIYFNNTVYEAGYQNAQELIEILKAD